MEQHKPVPENAGQKRTNLDVALDVVLKMLRREIDTLQIPTNELSLYQAAGLASGFRVEKIAEAGEQYLKYGDDGYTMIERLGIFTVKEGCVAVSMIGTRPESKWGSINYDFCKALGGLKQIKAAQSSVKS